MSNNVLYVGLDVHKNSIDVALAEAGGEIRHYGSIGGELKDLEKVIRKLHSKGSELHFAYEAGPCGYQIFRFLKEKNYPCLVAAPALIPRRPGDRIKCDRRDALTLARLFRAGELTAVRVPEADDEAMRDLTRAREDAISVERRAKRAPPPFCCVTAVAIRVRPRGAGATGAGCYSKSWSTRPNRSSCRNTWTRCGRPAFGCSDLLTKFVNSSPSGVVPLSSRPTKPCEESHSLWRPR